MSITTASPVIRTIVTSTSEQKVVQVMSDVWESFNFFTGTEIVNGELVSFDEMCRGQEKPVVNATEADLTAVRKNIVSTLRDDLITIDVSLSGKVVDLVQTGALVQVVKGRKVPVGTSGTVMKQGVSQFGRWVLILNENGNARTFVSLENLKVIDPLFNTASDIAQRTGRDFIANLPADIKTTADARRGLELAVRRALSSARWLKTNERAEWVGKVARGW
jgi:hypothetical protein